MYDILASKRSRSLKQENETSAINSCCDPLTYISGCRHSTYMGVESLQLRQDEITLPESD
jgi:hypothetical protein